MRSASTRSMVYLLRGKRTLRERVRRLPAPLLDQGPPPAYYLPLGRNASRFSLRGEGVVARTCGKLLASPPEPARSTYVKAYRRRLPILLLVLAVVASTAGCGGLGAVSGGKELTLGYIEWDENVAVSTLTKVLLEEERGYDKVELQLADLGPVFRGVADGELDAFQDVWMPNH